MPQLDVLQVSFEQCALCSESSHLQASHIVPGFVFDWLRNTSATGHFRFAEAPNLRVQDGLKPHMLCKDCEQLFSVWEKKFAEECFAPINSGLARNVAYGPWMLKFATSISWRVLRLFTASGYLSDFPRHIATLVDDAIDAWARFLLGSQPHPGSHEQHMFVVDVVESLSITNPPPNLSRYLARAIDIEVAHNEDSVITYAKMGKFVLFGFIAIQYPRRWEGTKLHVQRGLFGQRDIVLPIDIGEFIFGRARLTAEQYSQMSDRQRDKIGSSYEKDPDQVPQSDTFRAMHQDVLMFGKTAFEVTQPATRDSAKVENKSNDC